MRASRSRRVFATAVFGTIVLCAFMAKQAAAQEPYQVIDHWKVGGTGGWDYLTADSAAHLLYLSHNSHVEVVSTESGKVVSSIAGFKSTHGIALDDKGKYGYISDGAGNCVVVFDRHSFATIATVPVGTNPDGILFDPLTHTVWAFNGRSKNVSVIDAATNEVVATIALPGKPEFPVSDGHGGIFDPMEDGNAIVRLDATAKTLTATWKLTDCESPSGMAIDVKQHRLFTVCDGKKMGVVDTESGKQLASPAIGVSPDAAAFSPSRGLAFSSNGGAGGTLSVIDAAHGYAVLETLPTAAGARTMAYDEAADRVYVVTASFGPAPAATAQVPRPRAQTLPDTFEVIVIGRK